jgi:hypothetical protein
MLHPSPTHRRIHEPEAVWPAHRSASFPLRAAASPCEMRVSRASSLRRFTRRRSLTGCKSKGLGHSRLARADRVQLEILPRLRAARISTALARDSRTICRLCKTEPAAAPPESTRTRRSCAGPFSLWKVAPATSSRAAAHGSRWSRSVVRRAAHREPVIGYRAGPLHRSTCAAVLRPCRAWLRLYSLASRSTRANETLQLTGADDLALATPVHRLFDGAQRSAFLPRS